VAARNDAVVGGNPDDFHDGGGSLGGLFVWQHRHHYQADWRVGHHSDFRFLRLDARESAVWH
jgi:hypothetical protein